MVGFGEAIGLFYRNYVNFEGRATRAEYWWVMLYQLIVLFCFVAAFVAMAGSGAFTSADNLSGGTWSLILAGCLFVLVNFLPGLALEARRFHDLDQTAWLILVFFVVNFFVGVAFIAQWIWFAFKGTDGANKYGPDPFGYDADVFG